MIDFSPLPVAAAGGLLAANNLSDVSNAGTSRTNLSVYSIAQVDALVTGLLDFKGVTDCSANPNYPAASKGDYYVVSVAGRIGGGAGVVVEAGDSFFATADNAGGTQAAVGTSWTVIQGNILGGGDVVGPASSVDNRLVTFDSTTGKLIQDDSGITAVTNALAGVASVTGTAGNMTIIAGTGNSRTLTLQSTTSGGVATTGLTINAAQQIITGIGGTAALPAIAFAADATTGFRREAGGTMQMVIGGVDKLGLNSSSLVSASPVTSSSDGTAAAPAFVCNASVGIYRISASSLGLAAGTVQCATVTTTGGSFSGPAAAVPIARLVTIGDASRAGTDTNVGGSSGTIASGVGTGTGTASSLIFQTPTTTGSGSGAQSLATRLTLNATAATFGGDISATAGSLTVGATQKLIFSGNASLTGVGASKMAMGNPGSSTGVVLDVATDGTLIVRNRADSAGGNVNAALYIGSTQALSGPGAANVTTQTTKVTTTGALDAITLADGVDGQTKTILHDVDGGSFVLTPTTRTGWSTFTSTVAGESITLRFVTTRGWMVIGSFGGVIA